ncbi:hypothetical protein C8A03DRAFT_41798 [Achaetomium macrosporum]|uniref:Pkr1-domain-containing protein n=1 Tax=Achaetomium macrosporum TaxID=79813 RepID=A0AAN7CFJ0_9PEZI|nr:hypothetical protein C8A03DRAFT_41798 [Achaetomium macrosporum]
MAPFFQGLWESIFTPGPTPTLLVATNATFAALQVILAALVFATYSLHFVVLSVLSASLWAAINWFARELKEHQLQEEEKARRALAARPPSATSADDSETEVEATKSTASLRKGPPGPASVARAVAASSEVEPAETQGELKLRVVEEVQSPSQGHKSGVSTEDEWEKVSENENEKDR